MQALAEGGYVDAVPATARREDAERHSPGGGIEVHLHDDVGVRKTERRSRNERDQPRLDMLLDIAMADVLSRPGSRVGAAPSSGWGLSRSLARRA
ncbi:MAG: hypothetical protein COT28_03490 [Methylobacterium sp. CG08_land_8_20_14_0_20_71_15]|jgi:hypothetical protein|nr:MAG: hypothetical protein COT56_02240 [Methylobacterium sp. CG09_land_8_20_14_0_10_71_15]PIU15675.1 MAG: hypothetical protein COT28_03490 [Methylobacterium sp. CG08_land_8_20_14_0_20_71_15]GBU17268.1 hypothetical protein AwMethylo_14830 [Methylobacterium sp.]